MTRRFWPHFFLALLGQGLVLYLLALLNLNFRWDTFYDPIFRFVATRIKFGFNVVPIFFLVLLVFSAYAALISVVATWISGRRSSL